MPKKKHRKKVRSSKRAAPRKTTKHAKRPKGAKHSKHLSARAKPEGHAFSLLRAIKRRRAAERGKHAESHGVNGHHARKVGAAHRIRKGGTGHHLGKRSHREQEPVVTEKSFENMLAFRRFQNHAR